MTYEPTKEDVERAVQILNTHFPTRRGEFYRAISEALYSHHRALAERGVFVAEWQPIETVPQDRTPVLVWLASKALGMQVHVANFGTGGALIGGHFDHDMPAPIYWMPIPPEPKP